MIHLFFLNNFVAINTKGLNSFSGTVMSNNISEINCSHFCNVCVG